MDLFEQIEDKPRNILPRDGTVQYYGSVMSLEKADHYFETLMRTLSRHPSYHLIDAACYGLLVIKVGVLLVNGLLFIKVGVLYG